MRTSTIGWVALVSLALMLGTVGGACWGCWIADREWLECWSEASRDREDRERDLDDALGELAAETAELDRVRRERDDYRARYAVARRELETRQDRRWVVTTMPGTYTPPSDVISITPTVSTRGDTVVLEPRTWGVPPGAALVPNTLTPGTYNFVNVEGTTLIKPAGSDQWITLEGRAP